MTTLPCQNIPSTGNSNLGRIPVRRAQWLSCLGIAASIPWLQVGRAQAEDHVDYRYEFYKEDAGRIEVNTHSVQFEKKLIDAITVKGELVYDGISGATPTGSPPQGTNHQVPVIHMYDIRHAGNLEFDCKLGPQTLSPQVSYSKESDYVSTGISLNDAIDLNEKNTTLRLGVSHNFDRVYGVDPHNPNNNRPHFWTSKDSTDGLIGISQLLDPKTVLTADFTIGHERGYLDDPYRGVLFQQWLTQFPGHPLYITYPEVRPNERTKQVFQTTLTHFFDRVNGSAELSYRFHHDSYDVFSHTMALAWHQKIGKHVLVEPIFRFYEQSAAYFYFPQGVPGLSPVDVNPVRPRFYSADYRLSHMMTFTYGVQASLILKEWVYIDAGYQRYEMCGLDNLTSASAYPNANIYTIGLRIWF